MIEARIVECAPDFFERQPKLAADAYLLQAQQLSIAIQAVAGCSSALRHQQSDLIVMVQGAHRDPRDTGGLFHLIAALGIHAR